MKISPFPQRLLIGVFPKENTLNFSEDLKLQSQEGHCRLGVGRVVVEELIEYSCREEDQ